MYDPKTKAWTVLEIDGATPLACFGSTTTVSESELLIVGGTDGDMLQEGSLIVDFKNKKATTQS